MQDETLAGARGEAPITEASMEAAQQEVEQPPRPEEQAGTGAAEEHVVLPEEEVAEEAEEPTPPPGAEKQPAWVYNPNLVPSEITLEKALFAVTARPGEIITIKREHLQGIVERLRVRARDAYFRQKRHEELQDLDRLTIHTIQEAAKLGEYVNADEVQKAAQVLTHIYQTAIATELEIGQGAGIAADYIKEEELPAYGGEILSTRARLLTGLGIAALERTPAVSIAAEIISQFGGEKLADRIEETVTTTVSRARQDIEKYDLAKADAFAHDNLSEADWDMLSPHEQNERLKEAAKRLHLGKKEQLAILKGRQYYLREIPANLRSRFLESQGFYGWRKEEIQAMFTKAHDERMALFSALTGCELGDHLYTDAATLAGEETPTIMSQLFNRELEIVLQGYGVDRLSDLTPAQQAEAKYQAAVGSATRYGETVSWALEEELRGEVVSDYKVGRLDKRIKEYTEKITEVGKVSLPSEEKADSLRDKIEAVTGRMVEGRKEPGTLQAFESAQEDLITAQRTLDRETPRRNGIIESLEAQIGYYNNYLTSSDITATQRSHAQAQIKDLKSTIIGHKTQIETYEQKVNDADRNLIRTQRRLLRSLNQLGISKDDVATNGEIDALQIEEKLEEKGVELRTLTEKAEKEKTKKKKGFEEKKKATEEIKTAAENLGTIQGNIETGHIKPQELTEDYFREILGISTKEILTDLRLRRILVHKLGLDVDPKSRESWAEIKQHLVRKSGPDLSQIFQAILDNRIEAAVSGNPFGDVALREAIPPIESIEQLTDLQDLVRRDTGVIEGVTGLVEPVMIGEDQYVVVVSEGQERVHQRTTDRQGKEKLTPLSPDNRRRIHYDLSTQLAYRAMQRSLFLLPTPIDLVCADGINRQVKQEDNQLVVYEAGRRLNVLTEEQKRRPNVYLEPLVSIGEHYLQRLKTDEREVKNTNALKPTPYLSDDHDYFTFQTDENTILIYNLRSPTPLTPVKMNRINTASEWEEEVAVPSDISRTYLAAFNHLIDRSVKERVELRDDFSVVQIPNIAGKDYEASISNEGKLVIRQVRITGRPRAECPDIDLFSFLNSSLSHGYLSVGQYQRIQALIGVQYFLTLHKKV